MAPKHAVKRAYEIPEWVGSQLPIESRERWRSLISRLQELTAVGSPLEGWLFHGTTAAKAESIMLEGMSPTEVMLRDGADAWFTKGSYWARPIVAAGYAEDSERMDVSLAKPLGLIAIHIDDLLNECALEIDEPTLDFPEERLIGRSADQLASEWGLISETATWSDSLNILGSLAAIHSYLLPPESLNLITCVEDVESLLAKHSNHESLLTACPSP